MIVQSSTQGLNQMRFVPSMDPLSAVKAPLIDNSCNSNPNAPLWYDKFAGQMQIGANLPLGSHAMRRTSIPMDHEHLQSTGVDLTIQVIYINHRIRVKLAQGESLSALLIRVSLFGLIVQMGHFFEIEKPASSFASELGLLRRLRASQYTFVEQESELKSGVVYYLFFYDMNLRKTLKTRDGDVRTKPI